MEYEVLGWPPDGPKLDLDWRRFSYAGKFVMTNTGKAVARTSGEIVGAVSFNEDRTDDTQSWIRYVTVRKDYRGEGIGSSLTKFAGDRLLERYETIRTGANNPFSYHSFYKAGFGFVGETTGLAELVLERPNDQPVQRYRAGLEHYAERDLTDAERSFVDEHLDAHPPEIVEVPKADD